MLMSLERYRSTFIIVFSISIGALLLTQFLAPTDTYSKPGYLLLALYLSWALWSLLTRGRPVEQLMKTSFWVTAVFWLGLMALRLYGHAEPLEGVQRLSPTLYMVLIALTMVAHLLFSTQTALKASLGILTGTLLLSLGWLFEKAAMGQYGQALVRLLTYEAVLAVSILLLYALSKYKDDYAEAMLETERMRRLAYADVLTDLPNRRHLEEALEQRQSLTLRPEHPLSVILFDIDRFKEVNDRYGHIVGDQVLQRMSSLVRTLLRTGDVFGRWGGEEFLIIAPETGLEQADALADRLRQAIEEHDFGVGVSITASFGVATHSEGGAIDDLVHKADELLYQAKSAGRNRISSYSFTSAR